MPSEIAAGARGVQENKLRDGRSQGSLTRGQGGRAADGYHGVMLVTDTALPKPDHILAAAATRHFDRDAGGF
jgi:hypothetical protein